MASLLKKHKDYIQNLKRWTRCRDTWEGEDVVHLKGEDYMPKLKGQDKEEYDAYVKRAEFFNAVGLTCAGMKGLVARKDAIYQPAETGIDTDIDNQSLSVSEYGLEVLEEILITGRAATLVDYPETSGPMTVAQKEASGIKPYFVMYKAEDIYDWQYEKASNVFQLTYAVLLEEKIKEDSKVLYKFRTLHLEEGRYIQRLWTQGSDDKDAVQQGDDIVPTKGDLQFNRVPFFVHGSDAKGRIKKPPMLDLSNTNIHHYMKKADLSSALHFIALPTPWASGVRDDEKPKGVGAPNFWVFSDPEARVGILEFTGAGVEAIANECTGLEGRMAQQGARMLAPTYSKAETATATEIKTHGETSVLSELVKSTSQEIKQAYFFALIWNGTDIEEEDVQYNLNQDFLPRILKGADLLAMVSGWLQGAYSKETLFENLQRGEIIADGITFEQEQERIDDETGSGLPFGVDTDGEADDDEDDDDGDDDDES